MADENFEAFVQRERDRLQAEREALFAQQKNLDRKLDDISRQLAAIDAYEAARAGKTMPTRSPAKQGRRQARRGSKRDAIMQLIRSGAGLSRGELLLKMGIKGNKSGEMSVSNALTALLKANQIRRNEAKKYVVA
jgi:hypothetical protein